MDPNHLLVAVIGFFLLLPLMYEGPLSAFPRYFLFDWPFTIFRALPTKGPDGGFVLRGDTVELVVLLVACLAIGFVIASWLWKNAPRSVLPLDLAGVFVFMAGFNTVIARVGPGPRVGPLFCLVMAAIMTALIWFFGVRPEAVATRTVTGEQAYPGATNRVFDGSPESIKALQRFASGSAAPRVEAAGMAGPAPALRGLTPEAVQELMDRVKAGERYEDVAASLLARGAARPIEAEKRSQGQVFTRKVGNLVLHGFTPDDVGELLNRVNRGEAGEDVVASICARAAGRSFEVVEERPRPAPPSGKLGNFDDL